VPVRLASSDQQISLTDPDNWQPDWASTCQVVCCRRKEPQQAKAQWPDPAALRHGLENLLPSMATLEKPHLTADVATPAWPGKSCIAAMRKLPVAPTCRRRPHLWRRGETLHLSRRPAPIWRGVSRSSRT